jgi:hypothetical protein
LQPLISPHRQRLEFISLDLLLVLDDTLQLLEPQLRDQIEIVRNYDDRCRVCNSVKPWSFELDSQCALIANGNGRIVLATHNGEEDSLTVEVVDNGVGINPEDVEDYDPFLPPSVGRHQYRHGVGYGIVRAFRSHQRQQHAGPGTTFRIPFRTRSARVCKPPPLRHRFQSGLDRSFRWMLIELPKMLQRI